MGSDCALTGLSRPGLYYEPRGESACRCDAYIAMDAVGSSAIRFNRFRRWILIRTYLSYHGRRHCQKQSIAAIARRTSEMPIKRCLSRSRSPQGFLTNLLDGRLVLAGVP